MAEARATGADDGRPRGSATEAAILAAARELLAEGGVRWLTVEGTAERAGVAKTTIYRRYRSKDDLALAVLIDTVESVVAVPDRGDTRAELTEFVDATVRVLATTLMGRVMQGLVSDLAADEDLAEGFRTRVVGAREAGVRALVERGVARGDLRADVDPLLVHELLMGPVYHRLLLSGRPLGGDLAERLVAAVLPGIAAGPAPVSPPAG